MNLNFEKKSHEEGGYRIFLNQPDNKSCKIRFSFKMGKNFLDKFYLYAQHKGGGKKYSFPNFTLSKEPAGIRFGPWPGWRFVPAMPELKLTASEKEYKVKFYFTGDEENSCIINAYSECDLSQENELSLNVGSLPLELISTEIYDAKNITLAQNKISIKEDNISYRPRLLFNPVDLLVLKIRGNSICWDNIEKLFDNWTLTWKTNPEVRTLAGRERLNILDKILLSSFHALMTSDKRSVKKAKKTLKEFISISSQPDYEPLLIDTQTGSCLFYMCLVYDWIEYFLNEEEKREFKKHIDTAKNKLLKFLTPDRKDYAQAHFLGCISGLLAYSIVFYHEEKESKEYIDFIANAFTTAMEMLPDDGSYPHGINLWIYEYTFLIRITEMLDRFTNINFWERKSFWKNSSKFREISLSPDKLHGITFGDPQFRVAGDAWIHFLISKRLNNYDIRNFAIDLMDIESSGVDHRSVMPSRRIFEFIYGDDQKTETATQFDSVKYFQDTGQIFINKNDFLFTVKCGAPLGKKRHEQGEWSGYGHSDPCNGAFLVYYKNSFVFTGPESSYKRNTEFQNTITINGSGQIGDKMVWSPDFNLSRNFPENTGFRQSNRFCLIDMNLTPAYNDSIQAEGIRRELLVFDSGVILGCDVIELKNSNDIEWNIHSYSRIRKLKGNDFLIKDKLVKANIIFLNGFDNFQTGLTPFVPGYPNSGRRDYFLKITKHGYNAQFIYLLNVFTENSTFSHKFDMIGDKLWKLSLQIEGEQYNVNYDGKINVD